MRRIQAAEALILVLVMWLSEGARSYPTPFLISDVPIGLRFPKTDVRMAQITLPVPKSDSRTVGQHIQHVRLSDQSYEIFVTTEAPAPSFKISARTL